MKKNEVLELSFKFAVEVIKYCELLEEKKKYVIARQLLKSGTSIGANATIVCGNTIGRHAMIGAGGVVTNNVTDYSLMLGVPARLVGWVCECGLSLGESLICDVCKRKYIKNSNGIVEVI